MKAITLLLFSLGLAVYWAVAGLQHEPGYMDADYYYLGGEQLAAGAGFSEPVLWNYLDDPQGLPHPSHAYWMPLASLVAATGLLLAPEGGFDAAQLGFVLAAALVPPLTGQLAYRLHTGQAEARRRRAALLAGLLAVFSGFYLRFMTTTDTFAWYMLLGGLFAWLWLKNPRRRPLVFFSLGLLAGLMHLARAEGFLWLVPALASVFLFASGRQAWLLPLAGYALVMGPWFLRNALAFGTPLAPGSAAALWFSDYDQLFAFPAESISPASWWAVGLTRQLGVRLSAAWLNLQSAIAVQGMIFLTPLVVWGGLRAFEKVAVRMAAGMWLLLFLLMTLIFPFAGARGGYFHAAAALQPLLWALVPSGLDGFVQAGVRRRGWRPGQAWAVFSASLVIFAIALSTFLVADAIAQSQTGVDALAEAALQDAGAAPSDIVMVNNPPGYFNRTGRAAIVIPHGGQEAILAAARRYGARYLVLEPEQGLPDLYEDPLNRPGLRYLGTAGEARLFEVLP